MITAQIGTTQWYQQCAEAIKVLRFQSSWYGMGWADGFKLASSVPACASIQLPDEYYFHPHKKELINNYSCGFSEGIISGRWNRHDKDVLKN